MAGLSDALVEALQRVRDNPPAEIDPNREYGPLELLAVAARQFRFYEAQHVAKIVPLQEASRHDDVAKTIEKAAVNAYLAEMFEATVAKHSPDKHGNEPDDPAFMSGMTARDFASHCEEVMEAEAEDEETPPPNMTAAELALVLMGFKDASDRIIDLEMFGVKPPEDGGYHTSGDIAVCVRLIHINPNVDDQRPLLEQVYTLRQEWEQK